MINRIFIADDDDAILDYYHTLFTTDDTLHFIMPKEDTEQIFIETFKDGNLLLERFDSEFKKGKRIPLCILDVRMTVLGGIKTAEEIRKIDREVIIIIVTAYSDITALDIRKQLKNDIYYVKKPFNEEEFFSLVTSLVKNWNTIQKLHDREERLSFMHSKLEVLVNERTKELAEANRELVIKNIEQKKIEKKLLEEMEVRKILLDNMPCTALLIEPGSKKIIACNETSMKAGAVIGETCYSAWRNHDTTCPWCAIPENMEVGKTHHIELESMGTVSDIYWVKINDKMFLHYAFDITKQKLAEESLRNALNEVEELKNRLEAENTYLQSEIKLEHNFEEIITQSSAVKEVLSKVEQVATTTATVLILGESGTGKELIARAIHNISDRKKHPLVKVNCAALASTLIESELFGYEKGAFSGAFTRKIGRFELANGGTMFLDEIGELPLELQSKLLRVLQEGEFERLGSPHTIKVDVRIIAATNRNLEKLLKTGEFREDLYYRLNVFPIKLPPLREHQDDIGILVKHFALKYSAKTGKEILSVPQKVINKLQKYNWPGNVRELENVIERAIILSKGSVLELDEKLGFQADSEVHEKNFTTLKEAELYLINNALLESNWVIEGKRGAALILDIPPSTLRERIKKYGLKKPVLEDEKSTINKVLQECNWVVEGQRGAARRLNIPASTLREKIKKYGLKNKHFS